MPVDECKIVCICDCCENPIFEGEGYYAFLDRNYCEDCADNAWRCVPKATYKEGED